MTARSSSSVVLNKADSAVPKKINRVENYINGAWMFSEGTESVSVINPANGELLAECPLGTEGDVNRAVEAAKKAYTGWRETPVIDRVQILFRLKTLLEAHADELAQLVTLENGKTLSEARGDVRRGIQMVEMACGMPSLLMGQSAEDIASGIDCEAVRRPLGVFVAITPFNFPAMVPFWFWPFAVASGNTFVLKPSERVPLTQVKVFELIEKAGMPPGVINMVQGGKDVVNALITHPDVKGISFVGSTPVAKYVYQTATGLGKRVQALGGAKNFMVVLPDAKLDQAVGVVTESCTGCAGQRCLAGSVILGVGDETYKQLREKLKFSTENLVVGEGTEATTQVGPLISQAALERVKGLIQSAADEGAEILVDGRLALDGVDPAGYYLRPTLIAGVTPEMRIAREEVFGPVICLGKTETFEEAIAWLNESPYANTTSLFTSSGSAARQFSYQVDPSMIGINIGVPAPMAFFSFGGSKDSFFGDIKAHGSGSVNFYTDTKVTVKRWFKESSIW